MMHVDEGTLVAIRDDQLVDADAKEHLQSCPQCRVALDDARRRAAVVERSLRSFDLPVDLASAKARVRSRLDEQRAADTTGRRWSVHLRRAAVVLLVTAGAAYALPGSPIRGWPFAAPPSPDAALPAAVPDGQETPRGAIEVNVPDGRIEVSLTDVTSGSTVEVVWTDAAVARISAPAGSSFAFADGRAEASVAPGPVVVELPRFAPVISLEVDGRTFLRRSSGSLEVLEPTAERTDDRIRFLVTER